MLFTNLAYGFERKAGWDSSTGQAASANTAIMFEASVSGMDSGTPSSLCFHRRHIALTSSRNLLRQLLIIGVMV